MPQTDNEDEDDKWRRGEIAAALTHMYYMNGGTFSSNKLPRAAIGKLLGVNRQTVWRAIRDAESGKALAEELAKRLQPHFEEQARKREASRERRRKSILASNRRAKERRRIAKERKQRDKGKAQTV